MHFAMYNRFHGLLRDQGPERAADYALELGFSSVEMFESATGAPTIIKDVETAKRIRAIFEAKGLHFSCYSLFADLYHKPEIEKSLCQHAEIAAALGSPYLHHTALPWLTLTADSPAFDEAIETAVDAASRVAKYAAPLGITCIYEDQGMYLNGIKNFGIFYNEMKNRCSNVGICGDAGNILFVDEYPDPFFEVYKKDIKHVHLKDYLLKEGEQAPGKHWLPTKGGKWVRDTIIGDGVVNFEACINILKSVGYDGALAFENGHPEPFEAGTKYGMEHINQFL